MSGIGDILGINEEELITHVLELLFSEESILEQRWFFIPVNKSVILL